MIMYKIIYVQKKKHWNVALLARQKNSFKHGTKYCQTLLWTKIL